MPFTTEEEIKWKVYKSTVLVPAIKATKWSPINVQVQLDAYIPAMEKLFASAVQSYQAQKFRAAWLSFMRVATYIFEELRQHPKWRSLAPVHKDRLVKVLKAQQ